MSSASYDEFIFDASDLAVVQDYQTYDLDELLTKERQLRQLIDLKNSILVQQLKRRDILKDEVEDKMKQVESLKLEKSQNEKVVE